MSIDLNILAQELEDERYQQYLPDSPGIVVEMLNAPNQGTLIATRLIGIGTVMDTLGPAEGAALLDTLDSLKSSNSVIKWAFYLLEKGDLDVGLESTRTSIDNLVTQNVISLADANKIKDLANVTASRSEILFERYSFVTENDVRTALSLGE